MTEDFSLLIIDSRLPGYLLANWFLIFVFAFFVFCLYLCTWQQRNSPTKGSLQFFGEGLTFDDVLLMPGYSQVLPGCKYQKQAHKDIVLNVPLLSSCYGYGNGSSIGNSPGQEGGMAFFTKTRASKNRLNRFVK